MTVNISGVDGWVVPLVGFANPKYIALDINDSLGFNIADWQSYVVAFENAFTATIVHEQTLDPTGATGWFPVVGKTLSSVTALLVAGASATGNGFEYACKGVRARMRVTALTGADLKSRVCGNFVTMDQSTSQATGASAGAAAHDAAISGNPVRVAGRAISANYAAVSSGDVADIIQTLVGAQIVRLNSIPELEWQSTGAKTDLTDLVIKASAGAGQRNYMTGLQIQNKSAVATDFVIKDGATIIHTLNLPANMSVAATIVFLTALRSTAATAFNGACLTTGANVLVNAQGYTSP